MAQITRPVYPVTDGIWGSSLGAADMVKPNAADFGDPSWTWTFAWKKAGDNPPPRQFFNWLQQSFDWNGKYLLQRGIPEWNDSQDYYPGCAVSYNGRMFRCVAANTNVAPGNQTYWMQFDFSYNEIQSWRYIPPGVIMYYAQDGYPAGWLPCNGAAVSRTAYVDLYNTIGTRYGGGDGSTTFNLPNVGTRFIRGSYGLSTGYLQGDAIRNITGLFSSLHNSAHEPSGAFYDTGTSITGAAEDGNDRIFGFDASRVVPVDTENRPISIAFPAIIKY